MKKDDSLYLRHILDAIQDIESYVQGIVTLEAFSADGMRLNAVVRQLEVVGEAAAHLSMELRATHADVPWEKMIGMRNRLIHEYFGVDEEVIWKVSQEELQPLRIAVERILQKFFP